MFSNKHEGTPTTISVGLVQSSSDGSSLSLSTGIDWAISDYGQLHLRCKINPHDAISTFQQALDASQLTCLSEASSVKLLQRHALQCITVNPQVSMKKDIIHCHILFVITNLTLVTRTRRVALLRKLPAFTPSQQPILQEAKRQQAPPN